LSPALKTQILFHIYSPVIEKVEIFKSISAIEVRFLVGVLENVLFLPADKIVKQGDSGDKLYFI